MDLLSSKNQHSRAIYEAQINDCLNQVSGREIIKKSFFPTGICFKVNKKKRQLFVFSAGIKYKVINPTPKLSRRFFFVYFGFSTILKFEFSIKIILQKKNFEKVGKVGRYILVKINGPVF